MSDSDLTQTPAPKICSGCSQQHFHPTFITCDPCRERRRIRREIRRQNDEPRRRGRPQLLPAAYISQLSRLQPFDLGPMDQVCNHCGAKHWRAELPGSCTANNKFWMSCCKAGAVKIDLLNPPPSFLKDLYDDIGDRGKTFKNHIRKYNATFAFTSLRCENPNKDMPNMPFHIQGQMYHLQGPLLPSICNDNSTPKNPSYAQLYILDPEYAASIRFMENNRELDEYIINNLTAMFHEHNPFVMLYKSAYELLQNTTTATDENSFLRIAPSTTMELVAGSDKRTENLPTSNEVCAIIPNERSDPGFRYIRIYLRHIDADNARFTIISQNHALYMPLHYTLLFPGGDLGWHWELRLANDKNERLTQRAYYRFRLHRRANEYSPIFLSKRLFQQYLVDVWAICDQNHLVDK